MNNQFITFNIDDINHIKNRFYIYKYLRENDPCNWNEKYNCWILSRYDDVTEGLKNYRIFSSEFGTSPETRIPYGQINSYKRFTEMDPPDHNSRRKLVTNFVSASSDIDLKKYIYRNLDSYFNLLNTKKEIKIVEEFCAKYPIDTILYMLGVEEEDRLFLKNETIKIFQYGLLDLQQDGMYNIINFFRKKPPINLVKSNQEEFLDIKEILTISTVFIIGGHHTTATALVNLINDISDYSEIFEKVKQDASLIPHFVEESLRLTFSSQYLCRTITEDFELHGKKLKKGDFVMLLTGSANTDEKIFNDPLKFSLDREIPKSPLMFGHGVHRCVGLQIARMQLNAFLEKVIEKNFKFTIKYKIEKDKMDCDGTIYKEIILANEGNNGI